MKPRLSERPGLRRAFTSAAVAMLFATFAAAQESTSPLMRIHFIPFAVETYAPVTRTDIEEAAFYRIAVASTPPRSPRESDPPLKTSLLAMLRAHPTSRSIRESFIRLKVEVMGVTYYADNAGTVIESTTGSTFRLSREELRRLEATIVGLRGIVDLDACSGVSCAKAK